jgi:hypothetical protein
MATTQDRAIGTEAAILSRILEPNMPSFSPNGARDILALDFPQDDKVRMRQLLAKARDEGLSAEEQEEANNFERVGHLLNMLQSKARCSLKGR